MRKITEELLTELKTTEDIGKFLDSHESDFLNTKPDELLHGFMAERAMSAADVAKKSGTGNYIYKVLGGERKPSRDIIIAVSLGMNLSLEETQLLLRVYKLAMLDSRDKRDSIIIYAVQNRLSVFQADDLLDEKGFQTIN